MSSNHDVVDLSTPEDGGAAAESGSDGGAESAEVKKRREKSVLGVRIREGWVTY